MNHMISIIASMLLMLFAGFVYAWSMISAPIAAEFPNWTSAQFSMTFTICMTCFCLGGLLGGILLGRGSARANVRLSATLFFLGFFIAAHAGSLPELYVGFGVLGGLGSGFAYNAVMSTVPQSFPDRQGTVSGILLMSFGASSMIIGSVYTNLVESSAVSWRRILLGLGVLTALLFYLCAFFLAPAAAKKKAAAPAEDATSLTTVQMLRQPRFWCTFFWSTLLNAAGLAVIGQARPIALSISPGTALGTISLVVGLISVCNGLGRVLFGAMFDRCSRKTTVLAVTATFLFSALCITISNAIQFFPLLILGYVLLGLGYGGSPTSGAALTRTLFGNKYYSVNFSLMNCNLMIASFGNTIAGTLYDKTGSFASTFTFLLICIVLASFLTTGINTTVPMRSKKALHGSF